MEKKKPYVKDEYNAEYDAKFTQHVGLKFNKKTDADILRKLSTVPNKQSYVKELIRRDIAGG